MLVLTRQLHERILVLEIDTVIEVVAAKAGSVRLGIEAPPTVTVLREELARRSGPPDESLSPSQRAVQQRLDRILLGLSRLRHEAQKQPHRALGASVEKILNEVVLLSRQVSMPGEDGNEEADLELTGASQCR